MNIKNRSSQIVLAKPVVHMWYISLDCSSSEITHLAEVLSPAEINRAEAFHFERDRRLFQVSHGALRFILCQYVDCHPAEIKYQVTSNGKPFLVNDPELYFNLSHSHERAIVAVSRIHPLGVDIEHVRSLENIDLLARQCFSPTEYQAFSVLPESDRLLGFFNAWTRKEAFIKAIGDGLSYPLADFDVSLHPGEDAQLLSVARDPLEVKAWTMLAFNPGNGYVAACAVREAKTKTLFWHFTV